MLEGQPQIAACRINLQSGTDARIRIFDRFKRSPVQGPGKRPGFGGSGILLLEKKVLPRSLADIPISDLSAADRRVLLQHAVILTYIDGNQSAEETKLLGELVEKLRVPADEAKEILAAADERAKRLLAFL